MDVRDSAYGVPTIRTVKPLGGASTVLWRCPDGTTCNQAVSFDWASDGRRLAFSLDQVGGNSWYVMGLHVVDLGSGSDRQIPGGAPKGTIRRNGARAYVQRIREELGCWPAAGLDWSPDGTRIAYGCRGWPYPAVPRTFIAVLNLDGTGLTAIPTRGVLPRWPSWSPDGTRIAYSTGVRPGEHPSVYSVQVDGTHRRRVVENGTAPAWSPDGKTIAYWAGCGIRLVTPAGRDVTPSRPGPAGCDAIGRAGPPVWSPDGKKIAVEVSHRAPRAADGVYVMDADGANLERVSLDSAPTWYGDMPGRPSWRPIP
jgi:dipeptidyl aminopeptidase/acylaminoacyl peptidase